MNDRTTRVCMAIIVVMVYAILIWLGLALILKGLDVDRDVMRGLNVLYWVAVATFMSRVMVRIE